MKVVVFGATGVVGHAAAEHFASLPGVSVVAVSRRTPLLADQPHLPIDLSDPAAARHALAAPELAGTSHVVYAALQEADELAAGWRDRALMERNLRMFENALSPLIDAHGQTLRHVSLLQGTKAYGFHRGLGPLPARESAARADHENFYFLQEDRLRALAAGATLSWTVLRPQIVFGLSFGSPMNLLPAIGAYAALERERGRPLCYPGGPRAVQEAVDARLLARALAWAATAPEARGEIYNVTNGDVFDWHQVWPAIADALGMEVGEPRPQRLAEAMPARSEEWARLVDGHGLRAPRELAAFVGNAWQYADLLFGTRGARPLPALLSTIKLRRAGFPDCLDTEDMFRDWFGRYRALGLLPAR